MTPEQMMMFQMYAMQQQQQQQQNPAMPGAFPMGFYPPMFPGMPGAPSFPMPTPVPQGGLAQPFAPVAAPQPQPASSISAEELTGNFGLLTFFFFYSHFPSQTIPALLPSLLF